MKKPEKKKAPKGKVLSPFKLDRAVLGAEGMRILFRTNSEIEEWLWDMATELDWKPSKMRSVVMEIRIFFATVVAAVRGGAFHEGSEPTELPPILMELWTKMAQSEIMYGRFCELLRLPDEYRYQADYPRNRRLTATKLVVLLTVASHAGIEIEQRYWAYYYHC